MRIETLNRPVHFGRMRRPLRGTSQRCADGLLRPHAPLKPEDSGPLQPAMRAKEPEPQKKTPLPGRQRPAGGMENEAQACLRKFSNARLQFRQDGLVIMKQDQIVHIAHIAPYPQPVLDELIQLVQIQIGKKLAGQIAQRQAAAMRLCGLHQRCAEQIPPPERPLGNPAPPAVAITRLRQINRRINYLLQKPHQGVVGHIAPQDRFQEPVVNALEIPLDIQMQRIGRGPQKMLRAIQRRLGPLPASAGITVVDEHPVEGRFDDIMDRMVHHPVPERGRRDYPGLGVLNFKQRIPPMPVAPLRQVPMQTKHFSFQVEAETRTLAAKTTPASQRRLRRRKQVVQPDHSFILVLQRFHVRFGRGLCPLHPQFSSLPVLIPPRAGRAEHRDRRKPDCVRRPCTPR